MTEQDDSTPSAARVAELERVVRGLSVRVADLERRAAPGSWSDPVGPSPRISEPVVAAAPVAPSPSLAEVRAEHGLEQAVAAAEPKRGPSALAGFTRERLPVIAMGAVGGLVLLMGALYFVWYSIQQGWISAEVRLISTAVFGAASLALGWRLAPRGHTTVAASLGGVGIGAWFAAVLVARHVHAFIEPMTAFALLAVGAAAGITVATHRGLRLLAPLAALAAFLTPLVAGGFEGRLHELMTYQLVVVAFLYAIEHRRGWSELGVIASIASWGLLASTIQGHYPTAAAVVGWSFVYLVVGQAQVLSLLRTSSSPGLLTPLRLGGTAVVAWLIAAGTASGGLEAFTTLIMAGLNVATVLALPRVVHAAGWARQLPERERGGRALWQASVVVCLGLAWVQVFAFAPMYLNGDGVLGWWAVMAALVAVGCVRFKRYVLLVPFLLPFLAAIGWSLVSDSTTAIALGFATSALPLALALLPRRAEIEERGLSHDLYLAFLLGLGAVTWAALAGVHFEDRRPDGVWLLVACLIPAVPATLRIAAHPTFVRCASALTGLVGLVVCAFGVSAGTRLLNPHAFVGPGRPWVIGVLVLLAALAYHFVDRTRVRMRAGGTAKWTANIHDAAGLIFASAGFLISMLLVTGAVGTLDQGSDLAGSLNQVGWSMCGAVAGLALLVRGLFARRTLWRYAGMLLLFATVAKLIVIDTVQVAMIWRVVSFVGLGICLLLGAYAYRRLEAWLAAEPSRA